MLQCQKDLSHASPLMCKRHLAWGAGCAPPRTCELAVHGPWQNEQPGCNGRGGAREWPKAVFWCYLVHPCMAAHTCGLLSLLLLLLLHTAAARQDGRSVAEALVRKGAVEGLSKGPVEVLRRMHHIPEDVVAWVGACSIVELQGNRMRLRLNNQWTGALDIFKLLGTWTQSTTCIQTHLAGDVIEE